MITKQQLVDALYAAPTRTETNNADYVFSVVMHYLHDSEPDVAMAIQYALSYSGWHHHYDGQPGR